MPFDFISTYEAFAKALNIAGASEASYRNSVSRGYYSLYHKMRDYYKYPDGADVSHPTLSNRVSNDLTLQHHALLGNYMYGMKLDRVDADYFRKPKKGKEFNKSFCDDFWMRYNWFITNLAVSASPPSPQKP